MSATVPVYVKVIIGQEQWIEIEAATKLEAEYQACTRPDVVKVLESSYAAPNAHISRD